MKLSETDWVMIGCIIFVVLVGTAVWIFWFQPDLQKYQYGAFVCEYAKSTTSVGFSTVLINGTQTVSIPAKTISQNVTVTTTYLNGGYCPP